MPTTVETTTLQSTVTTSTNPVTVDAPADPSTTVTATTTPAVTIDTSPVLSSVTISNLQGPQGVSGGAAADKNFVHNQVTPQAIWTINHNLSKRPSVVVVDSADSVVVGDILYIDDNTCSATFSASFAGKAYCN